MSEPDGLGAPTEALDTIMREVGGDHIVAWEAMHASFSNTTHRLDYTGADGAVKSVVLRRYTSPLGNPQTKARVESAALQLLSGTEVPSATLVLADTDGSLLGTPGIVTSLLPGNPRLGPDGGGDRWVEAMAAMLARIHSISVDGRASGLLEAGREASWFAGGSKPTAEVAANAYADQIYAIGLRLRNQVPLVDPRLIHLDYWPGNLLWAGDEITGVVDWEEASWGDPAVDVAYCYADLVIAGHSRLASKFISHYRHLSGSDLDALALWEVAAAVRWMPDAGRFALEQGQDAATADRHRRNFAGFLQSAIERAGGLV